MKKYEEYKDSGIEWIGEIPEHWQSHSFRFCIDILTDYTANGSFASLAENVTYLESGYSRLVRLTDLRVNLENEGIYVDEHAHNFLKKSELFGGELLIANVGAYAGLVTIMPKLNGKYTLAPNMFLVRLNQDTQYFNYILNSPICAEQLKMMAISSAQPKLNKDNIREVKIINPPLPEQTAIANYLDRKTAQIDNLIAKKERLIELLQEERTAIINHAVTKGLDPNVPMKDSGIEWLGEIPEHWEVKRIKFICKSIKTGSTPPTEQSEYFNCDDVDWYSPSDFKELVLNDSTKKISSKAIEDGKCRLYDANSVLLIGIGATVGKIGLSTKKCSSNQQINAITFNEDKVRARFGLYYLDKIKEYIISEADSSTLPIFNQTQTKNIPFVHPSKYEQDLIVNFIEYNLERIKVIVEKISNEIDLLKEYKTALISEVVTGKVKVFEN